jgi:hypothetical protein
MTGAGYIRAINSGIRFALEIVALACAGFWGATFDGPLPVRTSVLSMRPLPSAVPGFCAGQLRR